MSDLEVKLDAAIMGTIWIRPIDKAEQQKVHPKWFMANGQMFTFGIDVDLVKQAFVEAGWFPPGDKSAYEKSLIESYLKAGGDPDLIVMSRTDWKRNAKLAGVMTGQEWLSKFEFYLDNIVFETWYERNKPDEAHEVLNRELILKAAKKAAGIE